MAPNEQNNELEQTLKEEKELFDVLWTNIVRNLKETLQDRLLNKRDLKMFIRKGVGCKVAFDCQIKDAKCRHITEETEFDLSSIYNQCAFDVKQLGYTAHMVLKNTKRKIDPIIIEFNYKGAQQFARPTNKHIIVVPVTFDMDLSVFDNGDFSECGRDNCIPCQYINFSEPAYPKFPSRFIAHKSGKSVVIGNVKGNECGKMYQKHNQHSILEIVFPHEKKSNFELFQMGLAECKRRGLDNISYCNLCANLASVWGLGSKAECTIYKDHALPRHPNDYTIIDCPYFKISERYNQLLKKLDSTPHIVHCKE